MNNDDHCGCDNNAPNQEKEFLMVKASASEASTCGVGENKSKTANCEKQENTFDVFLSDFLVPIPESLTSALVCNAAVYSVGQWIQSINPAVTLKIAAITGNVLSLINRCPGGEAVSENPNAGFAVISGTRFVACSEPLCDSPEKSLERLNYSLQNATELCAPSLGVSSITATVSPVGRVESDLANTTAGKCLKRIFGILFNGGTPILSALDLVPSTDSNYRRVAKHKVSNRIVHLKNHSEEIFVANKTFSLFSNASSEVIRETNAIIPINKFLSDVGNAGDPSTWPVLNTDPDFEIIHILNFEPIALMKDHYHVMVLLEIAAHTEGGGYRLMRAFLNNDLVGHSLAQNGATNFNAISTMVRIDRITNQLKLRLSTNVDVRYRYRMELKMICY